MNTEQRKIMLMMKMVVVKMVVVNMVVFEDCGGCEDGGCEDDSKRLIEISEVEELRSILSQLPVALERFFC